MTKEECEKALEELRNWCDGGYFVYWREYYEILQQLIKEHFNPSAYRFEELKEGIPYYHDGLKKFCLLVSKCSKDTIVLSVCTNDGSSIVYVEFEENSFYPATKVMQYQERGIDE